MTKSFPQMWQEAIDADPCWQFEELLEEDPEEAERVVEKMWIATLVSNRLHVPIDVVYEFLKEDIC